MGKMLTGRGGNFMKFATLRGVFLALAVFFAGPVLAQYHYCLNDFPITTPSGDFFVVPNGTVLHLPTGLIWKRCSEGEIWTGTGCSGSIQTYSWPAALQRVEAVNATETLSGNDADWRLPNVNELQSIVERGCAAPSINLAIFPGTQGFVYWASSPFEKSLGTFAKLDSAWLVGFYYGGVGGRDNWDALNQPHPIRLVRSGHGAARFDLLAPRTPTNVSFIPGDQKITISFTASPTGPTASSFSASCSDGSNIRGVIDVHSPIVVNNLTNGVSYTCSVTATNGQGSSLASASTFAAPLPTVPDAPALLRLVSGNHSIRVVFSPPTSDGGSSLTGYRASCSGSDAVPHQQTGTGLSIVVPGLTNGLTYSCNVRAINSLGDSLPSGTATQVAKKAANLTPIISILLAD
jgi:hypothetical protein